MKHESIEANQITAKSIQLVDDHDRTRARLETHGDSVVVQLCDKLGMPRLELSLVDNQHASIHINRPDGNQGIGLTVRDGQAHGIGVCDQDGNPVVQIGVQADDDRSRGGFPAGALMMLIDPTTGKTWSATPTETTSGTEQEPQSPEQKD